MSWFLSDVFENFVRKAVKILSSSHLHNVGSLGYCWQCGVKKTADKLQNNRDQGLIQTIKNNVRGDFSSVKGDRLTQSNENTAVL